MKLERISLLEVANCMTDQDKSFGWRIVQFWTFGVLLQLLIW